MSVNKTQDKDSSLDIKKELQAINKKISSVITKGDSTLKDSKKQFNMHSFQILFLHVFKFIICQKVVKEVHITRNAKWKRSQHL